MCVRRLLFIEDDDRELRDRSFRGTIVENPDRTLVLGNISGEDLDDSVPDRIVIVYFKNQEQPSRFSRCFKVNDQIYVQKMPMSAAMQIKSGRIVEMWEIGGERVQI